MATSLFLFVIVIIITSITQLALTILGFFGIFGAVIGVSFGIPLLLLNAVLSAFLQYTCWKALPAGYRKNDPLTTSLLLLVPFFKRLAKHYNGELSMAQMTMHMNCGTEELKRLVNEAQKDGYAEIVNHVETGMIRYKFDIE